MPRKKNGKTGNTALKTKPLMSEQARKELTQRIEQEKQYLQSLKNEKGSAGVLDAAVGRDVDQSKVQQRIRHMQKTLKHHSIPKLTAAQKDALGRERTDLETWITKMALTKKEMDYLPRHGYEFSRAVRKSTKQEVGSPEFTKKAERYRYISRLLEPDDPEAGSIEKLRA